MTADTPARVSDEELAVFNSQASDPLQIEDRIGLDLRDARALVQSQAATIAELRAEVERLKEAVAMLPNKIESEGVTPRPPGASDWWATAVGERRKRKAAESALAETRAKVEGLEKIVEELRPMIDADGKFNTLVWAERQPRLLAALSALPEAKPAAQADDAAPEVKP